MEKPSLNQGVDRRDDRGLASAPEGTDASAVIIPFRRGRKGLAENPNHPRSGPMGFRGLLP